MKQKSRHRLPQKGANSRIKEVAGMIAEGYKKVNGRSG
jgi:hypothetical protein